MNRILEELFSVLGYISYMNSQSFKSIEVIDHLFEKSITKLENVNSCGLDDGELKYLERIVGMLKISREKIDDGNDAVLIPIMDKLDWLIARFDSIIDYT